MIKKLTLGWIIVFILSVLGFTFYFTKGNLLNYVLKPYLETLVSQETHLKITIDRIDFSILRASLNIFNIEMMDPASGYSKAQVRTHITIPEIRASLQIRQLLLGHLALDQAFIHHPTILWVIHEESQPTKKINLLLSWGSILPSILRFDFNRIQMTDASLTVKGPNLEMNHPNLAIQIDQEKGRKYRLQMESLESKNHMNSLNLTTKKFRVESMVSFPLKISGKLAFFTSSFESYALEELTSSFTYENGKLDLLDSKINTSVADLSINVSMQFKKLFEIQSGSFVINSIPFKVISKSDESRYLIESQEVDLSKIFNKWLKINGVGTLSTEISFIKPIVQITSSLALRDASISDLVLGTTSASMILKNHTLTTEINFKHPQRDSGGKIEATYALKSPLPLRSSVQSALAALVGSVEIKNFYLGPEVFSSLQFPFVLSETQFSIPSLTLKKKSGKILASFSLDKEKKYSFSLESQGLALEEFDSIPSFLRGSLHLKGQFAGTPSHPTGDLKISIAHTFIESNDVGASTLTGEFQGSYFNFSSSLLNHQMTQKGQVHLKTWAFTLESLFSQLDFVPYFKTFQKKIFDFKGDVSGKLMVDGMLWPYQIKKGSLELKSLSFSSGPFSYANKNPLVLDLRTNGWTLRPFTLEGTNTQLTLQGQKDAQDNMFFSIEGPFNFHLLQLFVPSIEKSSGEAKVAARIEGKKNQPSLFGTLTVSHGELKTVDFPQLIDDLSISIGFSKNKIAIDKFKGSLGGGDIDIFGSMTLLPSKKDPKMDLFAKLDHCSIQYPSWFSSSVSGELSISGTQPPFALQGNILVHDALYKENLDWQSKIFVWQRERYLPKTQGIETPYFINNISFDIPKNLFIRNNVAKMEIKGSVKLIGTSLTPNILGNIDLVSGVSYFKGNEFTLTSAHVRFDHPTELNPSFVIHAEGLVKNYKLYLSLDGNLSKYSIHLTADPPLQEADIVSLLTLGATRSEIEAQGVFDVTSLELGSLLFGGVQEKVQSAAQKTFGFTFMLSPSYSDTKHATVPRLFIGRSLGRKIDTTFSSTLDKTAIFTDKEFNLKFNINRHLSLLGFWEDLSDEELQDNSSLGLDLKAQFEFQ